MGGGFLCPFLPFQHSECLKFVRCKVVVAKTRAFCGSVLFFSAAVDEGPRELSLMGSSPELKQSQENLPPTFLPVIAAQEEKFKLVEEILLLCGSTNVYGLILEMESLPAARVLIVCKYKHKVTVCD